MNEIWEHRPFLETDFMFILNLLYKVFKVKNHLRDNETPLILALNINRGWNEKKKTPTHGKPETTITDYNTNHLGHLYSEGTPWYNAAYSVWIGFLLQWDLTSLRGKIWILVCAAWEVSIRITILFCTLPHRFGVHAFNNSADFSVIQKPPIKTKLREFKQTWQNL